MPILDKNRQRKAQKKWVMKNHAHLAAYARKRRAALGNERDREYRRKRSLDPVFVACRNARGRAWYAKHKERVLEGHRKRRATGYYRKFQNDWKKRNPERNKEIQRQWRQSNRPAALKRRIAANLRKRVREVLKGNYKSAPTLTLLGCSLNDFKIYLESKFEVGMTWENYGKEWQMDHIMPCAIFDLTKSEHQKRCFHFSNLQPMWARQNLLKGRKVITSQYNLL